ncbi:hypothetical protein [Actinocorallia libanotica]|uniref:Uncharacterized protein n=1 Tax=Actinocorallia libanotica TaxID=46162 RepID=A0ABP4C322_9ACTN
MTAASSERVGVRREHALPFVADDHHYEPVGAFTRRVGLLDSEKQKWIFY